MKDIDYYKQYEPIFGAWHITKLIGEGSFGRVFEIEREDFGVTYKAALKAITVPASQSEIREVMAEGMDESSVRTYFGNFVQDLVKEFALMSKLKGNSHVVSYENHQVIEHGDGIGWDILIQMELLTPLNEYTRKNTVTRQDVIKLGIDLCMALELCQKYNIIHRDVKPENIFLSEAGDFKLGDFGIARTVEKTTSGLSKKGTYTYMAPEVYKGEPYGSTVDLYSLGVVLYRLLNGNRTPFLPAAPAPITHADRENALVRRFSGAPLPPPSHAQGRLAEIVLKACAYNPKERYSSPIQMRQELEAILYNREERQFIYPEGDDVPQDSVHYVKTGDEAPAPIKDRTVSDFGKAPGRASGGAVNDRTVSDFGAAPARASGGGAENDRTVSDFGEAPARAFGGSAENDRTVSDFGKVGTASGSPAGGWEPTQNAPARRRLPLLIGAGCLGLLCAAGLLLSLLGRGGSPAVPTQENTAAGSGTSASAAQQDLPFALTVEIGDFREEKHDAEGRVTQQPYYQWDGSVACRVYTYDEAGRTTSSGTYDLLGGLISMTLYLEYDGDGHVLRYETYDENGNLELQVQNTFQDGTLQKSEQYNGAGSLTLTTTFTTQENADGSTVQIFQIFDQNGMFYHSSKEERDAGGTLLRSSSLDEDGSVSSVTEYEMNSDGTEIANTYDSDGTLSWQSYLDDKGRPERSVFYDETGGTESESVYRYDADGFRLQKEVFRAGELSETTAYTFSEDGRLASLSTCDAAGVPLSAETYDRQGNLSSRSEYEDGVLHSLEKQEYDEDGNCVKVSVYDGTETLQSSTESEYNASGIQTKQISYRGDGSIRSLYEYDPKTGNLTRYCSYSEDGTGFDTRYQYNEAGEVERTSEYDENGTLQSYSIYKFDEDGNRIQRNEYRADGTQSLSISYNAAGDMTESRLYTDEGTLSSCTYYEYDGKLLTRITQTDGKGAVTQYTEYEYNAEGTKILESSYEADGTPSDIQEYDSNGNCTRRSSYFQGELDFYYEMEYDEEDRVIRQRNYDGDGTLKETAVTEYGIDGTNDRRVSYYDRDGTLTEYEITRYDEDGSYLETVTYNADGTVQD